VLEKAMPTNDRKPPRPAPTAPQPTDEREAQRRALQMSMDTRQ